jgi:hypothetical protein
MVIAEGPAAADRGLDHKARARTPDAGWAGRPLGGGKTTLADSLAEMLRAAQNPPVLRASIDHFHPV